MWRRGGQRARQMGLEDVAGKVQEPGKDRLRSHDERGDQKHRTCISATRWNSAARCRACISSASFCRVFSASSACYASECIVHSG